VHGEEEEEEDKDPATCDYQQSKLLTGGTLRNYQLAGVDWLIRLFNNGLNGILADETGLGKTVQVVALFADLNENGVPGPCLVVRSAKLFLDSILVVKEQPRPCTVRVGQLLWCFSLSCLFPSHLIIARLCQLV
jgi:hypothetical protein